VRSAISVRAGTVRAGTESHRAEEAGAAGEKDAVGEPTGGRWRTGEPLGLFASTSPGLVLTSRDIQEWLSPLAMIAMIGVTAGIVVTGVPGGSAGAITVTMLVAAAALSAVALSKRICDLRVVVPALVGVGLCGAGLGWQAEGGPGFIAGYVSLMGLALRTPRRVAILAGVPVVAAIAVEETYQSANPTTTILAVLFASGLLFITSAFAAISLDARQHAEALLAQEAATSEARQRAAALAERSRLARDLHDVLAHNLSALAVQLEATRLMAINMGAGSKLVGQVASARKLTCIGMLEARRALQMLRDGEPPGQASLQDLISETASALGIPITVDVRGVPRPLGGDAELTLYRVVQEALTNVAKHAGRGARVGVRLAWASGGVEVSIMDSGGDGVDAGLPSSGFGLSGMAERATLVGGRLRAGRSEDGFAVQLWLPVGARVPEPAP
jgi:signal transduction histidine kinase